MKNKLSFIFIIAIVCVMVFPYIVSATEIVVTQEITKVSTDLGLGDLNNYKGDGENATKFISKVEGILSIIQMVGVILSVIILVMIGIKYMLGSVEEKADYKKSMIPYLIGALMVFSVTTLPQLIFLKKLNKKIKYDILKTMLLKFSFDEV